MCYCGGIAVMFLFYFIYLFMHFFTLPFSFFPAPSPEHATEDSSSLRPPSLRPSPHSSPTLSPRMAYRSPSHATTPTPSVAPESEDGGASSLASQQVLGSTETLKRGGGGAGDEQLLSSCESAKTICDSVDSGGAPALEPDGRLRPPSINIEEEDDGNGQEDESRPQLLQDEGPGGEVDQASLADGSLSVESEDRFEWVGEDAAPRRPDSLKGIQSFQRSQSNLASLGLAFPAQNGSLAIGRWPSVADRTPLPDDWESYTYSPGYERAQSKADSCNDR